MKPFPTLTTLFAALGAAAVSASEPVQLSLLGRQGGAAFDVNDAGTVAGYLRSGDETYPVLWVNREATLLPVPNSLGAAHSVNNAGVAVGFYFDPTIQTYRAAMWRDGEFVALPDGDGGPSGAVHISESGVVAGYVSGSNGDQAAIWINGSLTTFQGLNGGTSRAQRVLANGTVLGVTYGISESGAPTPTAWIGGVPVQLGFAGDGGTVAAGNSSGVLVGSNNKFDQYASRPATRNVTEGGIAFGGIVGQYADGDRAGFSDINDAGQTTGFGYFDNGVRAFRGTTSSFEPLPALASHDIQQIYGTAINAAGDVAATVYLTFNNRLPVLYESSGINLIAPGGVPGQIITLQARARDRGRPMANQPVQFVVEGRTVGTARTNANGIARLGYTIPASALPSRAPVRLLMAGGRVGQGSLNVRRAETSIKVDPAVVRLGQTTTLTARVLNRSLNAPAANTAVVVMVGELNLGIHRTDANGNLRVRFQAPTNSRSLGGHPLKVRFPGTPRMGASQGRATLTVRQ